MIRILKCTIPVIVISCKFRQIAPLRRSTAPKQNKPNQTVSMDEHDCMSRFKAKSTADLYTQSILSSERLFLAESIKSAPG